MEDIKNQKPITLLGNISAALNYNLNISPKDTLQNIYYGSNPSYTLQASPVITLYGVSFPMYFLMASQSKSFSTPFNRYGLSPYYKWVKLHLGWRTLNFSQFTLNGQQILGAGAELTPGKFRLAFMYGKFNKGLTNISQFNNLNNNTQAYKRKGWAAKIGYGGPNTYLEFSYLQAADDSTSLPEDIHPSDLNIKPKSNKVLGIKTQIRISHHLYLNVEGAASLITRDATADTIADLPSNTILQKFAPQISSYLPSALEARLRYNFRKGNIYLKYHRIDPGFQSMGAFYMQTDIEQASLGLNMSFFQNKLNVRSDIGLQRNNLAHIAVFDSKRTIGSTGVSINPTQNFGLDINYTNYGISQQIVPELQNPADIIHYDSILISQINQSFSLSPHLTFNSKSLQHTISLSLSLQSLKNNNGLQGTPGFRSIMSSLIYVLMIPDKQLSFNNSINYFKTAILDVGTSVAGYNLGISKRLDQADKEDTKGFQNLMVSFFAGYFANFFEGKNSGHSISLNPQISIGIGKKQSFLINANFNSMNNKNNGIEPKRNQVMLSARYNLSF